jgi:hypothetical protein
MCESMVPTLLSTSNLRPCIGNPKEVKVRERVSRHRSIMPRTKLQYSTVRVN